MAVVTSVATRNVVRRLSGRRETVVTGAAGSVYLGMVDDVYRRKRIRVVAIFAHVCGRNVRWILAGGVSAIMAARTISRDIDVVEVGWYPASSRMTIVAGICRVEVRRMLAGCRDAVMTRAAGANDLCVIYREYWSKNISRMAVLTHIAGLDMRDRFAGCLDTIVAAEAIAADIHVVEIRRQPAQR